MGFSTCNYDVRKLASALGVEEKKAAEALKSARKGGFARIWAVEDKGNYSIVQLSTSKKNREGEGVVSGYKTDYQNRFMRFVGEAHEKIKGYTVPTKGVTIRLLSTNMENYYNPEKKKSTTTVTVFDFDFANSANPVTTTTVAAEVEEDDDDLPF